MNTRTRLLANGVRIGLVAFLVTDCSSALPAVRLDELRADNSSGTIAESVLPAKLVEHDVRILEYALTNGWGGNACGLAKLRVTVNANLDRLKQHASLSPKSFCEAIAHVLDQLPDAHFQASVDGESCAPTSTEKSVGSNFNTTTLWQTAERRAGNTAVGLLSVTRFPAPAHPNWAGLTEAIEGLKRNPSLIIDLRGNGGGDDTEAYRIVQQLAGHFVARDGVQKIVTQTPTSILLRLNGIRMSRHRQPDGAPFLAEIESELQHDLDEALAGRLPSILTMPATQVKPAASDVVAYRGRIYVLQDRDCGSSCENAVELLRRLPNVLTVGANTAGAIHFGNAGKLVLPGSHVEVQIATHCKTFDGGRMYEKIGFAPDVRVSDGGDALEVALAKIRQATN